LTSPRGLINEYEPAATARVSWVTSTTTHDTQKDANRAHVRLRGPGERANAQLKTWRILRKLRCCPRRAGRLANAIHVMQTYEITAGVVRHRQMQPRDSAAAVVAVQ
jgi:hypothetical protein